MATRKNPTNADIIREIQSMNNRIVALESWKIAEDSAKKAVAEYRAQEAKTGASGNSINKELVKAILYALGVIGALVAIIQGAS